MDFHSFPCHMKETAPSGNSFGTLFLCCKIWNFHNFQMDFHRKTHGFPKKYNKLNVNKHFSHHSYRFAIDWNCLNLHFRNQEKSWKSSISPRNSINIRKIYTFFTIKSPKNWNVTRTGYISKTSMYFFSQASKRWPENEDDDCAGKAGT